MSDCGCHEHHGHCTLWPRPRKTPGVQRWQGPCDSHKLSARPASWPFHVLQHAVSLGNDQGNMPITVALTVTNATCQRPSTLCQTATFVANAILSALLCALVRTFVYLIAIASSAQKSEASPGSFLSEDCCL